MTTLDEALRWLDVGVTPIPLIYRSKQPVVKWKRWESIQPPAALVKRWFNGLRNIAIVLNGNLIVLDFDIPVPYLYWRTKHPTQSRSYTVKSNRGFHVYLRTTEQVATANMEGGEILAAGHMLTVPPSVHRSGHQYQTINSGPILNITSLDEIHIKPIVKDPTSILAGETEPQERRVWLPTGGEEYGERPVERIKQRVDMATMLRLIGISQLPNTATVVLKCPFHDDKIPSLQVWLDQNKAYCHATSCRAHHSMDVIDMAALWWKVSNTTAMGMLLNM